MEYRTVIIEDDKLVRELLAFTAKMRGHEVLMFSSPRFCPLASGEDCINGVACCDMIISNQMMPYMTGLEFFSILKEKNCYVTNKAIVTAFDLSEIKGKADELGCHLISKPFKVPDILSWLLESESKIKEGRKLIPIEDLLS